MSEENASAYCSRCGIAAHVDDMESGEDGTRWCLPCERLAARRERAEVVMLEWLWSLQAR